MLFPEVAGISGFDVVRVVFRCVIRASFAFVSLILTRRVCSRLLTVTFTTAAFDRSSSRLFEALSYKTAPRGPPSSLVQHDAFASLDTTCHTLGIS